MVTPQERPGESRGILLFCDPESDVDRLRENSPVIPEHLSLGSPDCDEVMTAFEVGCEPPATLSGT
jgi:hypothetical protein